MQFRIMDEMFTGLPGFEFAAWRIPDSNLVFKLAEQGVILAD